MQSIGHGNFNSELLNVIYDNIVNLKNGYYLCEAEDKNILVDSNGNDICIKDDKTDFCYKINSVQRHGNFLWISLCKVLINQSAYALLSTKTNRYILVGDGDIELLTDDILLLTSRTRSAMYEHIIYDNEFRKLGSIPQDARWKLYLDAYKSQNGNLINIYCTFGTNFKRKRIILDTQLRKVLSYDTFEITDKLSAVATSTDGSGISISEYCEPTFKYRLNNNGTILGKEYEDIIDRAELQNTDFLYVYDSKGKIGVINRNNANEVVTPKYSRLEYVGYNNFIASVSGDKCTEMINADTGDTKVLSEIAKHSTLPILIMKTWNNVVVLYNIVNGMIFGVADFSKQFKCHYSKNRPDLIRVDLAWGSKYITNTLVPITNLAYIEQLKSSEWISM